MARTIEQIKNSITTEFMGNTTIAQMYGFTVGSVFLDKFSKASLENLLFYIVAYSIWVLEKLFDVYKQDVGDTIDSIIPHRPKWYVMKVKSFMQDEVLVTDTDYYDTTGMSDADVVAKQVVKHAVCVESATSSQLIIKVAGESGGNRAKLDDAVAVQLTEYIQEIKDAGVRFTLVNKDADYFDAELDIYYNAMQTPEMVKGSCEAAIKNYIENLPFNGEFTNMAFIDAVQLVEGVKIVELKNSVSEVAGSGVFIPINAKVTPEAGYFVARTLTLNMIAYAD